MKKLAILCVFALLAVSMAACGASLPNEMLDTTWEWQQLIETAPAGQSAILGSENYTIVFAKDGLYNVKADCNVLAGEYQATQDSLTLLPGPSTLAECGPESSYNQYVTFLSQVDGYKLEGGRLILTFGNGAGQMIFANAGPAK